MKPLGKILIESFGLNEQTVSAALTIQKEKGGRLGRILVQKKKISEQDLLQALSLQCGLELRRSLPPRSDPFFTERVPIGFLKKFKMIPVATPKESFIAVSDPFYFQQLDDLQRILHWEGIKSYLVPSDEIFIAINTAYDRSSQGAADQVLQDIDEDDPEAILSEIEETADLLDDTSDAPVIKLVNLILSQAVRDNASDIHIEPYKDQVKIRKRVDGILYDMITPPTPKHTQIAGIIGVRLQCNVL
ncbi:MAG: type II secretion system protein GspE, partial [Candidatus Electrothrix sp. AR4]|nr:type II secretion system protein GspE [Candidatus Electrothrix sp. AR4]